MCRRMVSLLLVSAVTLACENTEDSGSSGHIPAPPLNVTATWTGTWLDDIDPSRTGTITLVLVQSGTAVTGDTTMAGDPDACFGTGDPDSFEGTVGPTSLTTTKLLFIDDPPGLPNLQDTQVTAQLDALNKVMTGTYEVTKHPVLGCRGDTGTIQATRP
jgi:hypothetical protein